MKDVKAGEWRRMATRRDEEGRDCKNARKNAKGTGRPNGLTQGRRRGGSIVPPNCESGRGEAALLRVVAFEPRHVFRGSIWNRNERSAVRILPRVFGRQQ